IGWKPMPHGAARKWYAWTFITLLLGLLAKPMLVTWPFVMLLLDYWPLDRMRGLRSDVGGQIPKVNGEPASRSLSTRRSFMQRLVGGGGWSVVRGLVVEKIPLFALVTASAVVTFVAQSHGGAVRSFTEAPITLRLSNALVSYAKYLLLAFWPNDLAVYYPYAGIPAWQIIGAAFLLIGITAFCVFQSRKHSGYLMVGWLWFLGT